MANLFLYPAEDAPPGRLPTGQIAGQMEDEMSDGYELLPEHMRDGMRRYIEHGIPPGSFLAAVLSNDLMGALGKADDFNRHALPNYGRFLYNHAPCGCHGSPDRMFAWIARGGLNGLEGAA